MGLISTGALYVINEPLKKIGGGGVFEIARI